MAVRTEQVMIASRFASAEGKKRVVRGTMESGERRRVSMAMRVRAKAVGAARRENWRWVVRWG
jgi:hypothetical protein